MEACNNILYILMILGNNLYGMGRIIPEKPGIRNLQSIKKGSYILTIPKWWVEKHGLEKGSKLLLNEDGYSLRIYPLESIEQERRVELNFEEVKDIKLLRYMILTYYMQGVNRVAIKLGESVDYKAKQLMRDMRLDMPGSEIVRDDSEYLVYQIPSNVYPETLDEMMMQLHDLAVTAHRESIESIMNNDTSLARDVVNRESEMLRIYRKLIRNITLCSINPAIAEEKGIKTTRELLSYVLASRDLNRIVYHSIYISRHYLSLKDHDLSDRIKELISDASEKSIEMQNLAVHSFINKDLERVFKVTTIMPEIRSLEDELDRLVIKTVTDVDKAHRIMMIGREIRRIAGFSVAIADAAANRILFIE